MIVLHFPVRGIQREAYGEHDRHCDEDGPSDEVLLTYEEGKKKTRRKCPKIPACYKVSKEFSNVFQISIVSKCP